MQCILLNYETGLEHMVRWCRVSAVIFDNTVLSAEVNLSGTEYTAASTYPCKAVGPALYILVFWSFFRFLNVGYKWRLLTLCVCVIRFRFDIGSSDREEAQMVNTKPPKEWSISGLCFPNLQVTLKALFYDWCTEPVNHGDSICYEAYKSTVSLNLDANKLIETELSRKRQLTKLHSKELN